MYPRIAVLLSVSGVLVASTASALGDPGATRSAAPSSSGSSVTATTVATSGTTPDSSAPVLSASTVPDGTVVVGEPVPGSATQQSFRLGDAATVIVDTADGRLTFVVIAPHPGWTLIRAEQLNSESLEIRLESPNGEVRFDADLVGGAVVTSLRNGDDNTSTTIGTGSTVGSGSTVSSGSTGTTVEDDRDDGQNDDDDTTSSTIGTGTTVGTGSTGTTVDDDGGDDNGGSGNSGDDNSGSGNSGSGNSGSGG